MKPITKILTVDAIIIYNKQIVLIKRRNEPFKDKFALIRESKEETNLDIDIIRFVGIYSKPNRDPRGHTVSVCFLARGSGILMSGDDAKDIELFNLDKMPELAFDHNKMINNLTVIDRKLFIL